MKKNSTEMSGMKHSRLAVLNKFLVVLSVLASLKMIIFAVGLDEEYQVVMAYRSAIGDRLFMEMWEPHQSSAFLCTILMKPYLMLFGTTGIVLYLRVWGTLLHLGVSYYLYRVLKGFVGKDYSWLLALIYFNTIPKQIMLPEFGMMQVWFYTLLVLFLIRFYNGEGKKVYFLVLAALSLALNILSYPSCLILFPFALLFIARFSGKDKWRHMGIFTLCCGLCAIGYLGLLFTYTSPKQLLETLSNIVNGDITHSFSAAEKLFFNLWKGLYETLLWAGCMLLSLAAAKWKKLDKEEIFCLSIILACAVQLFYWGILNTGYESMHIHLIAAAAAGLCTCGKLKEKRGDKNLQISLMRYGIAGAVLCLLGVVYLTDISLTESIPHAMPAAFFGAVLLIFAMDRNQEKQYSKWVYAVLLVWCITAVFGKGYTLRAGGDYSNVLQSGGILKEGPAAGTISNYIRAYIYNCDYEDWKMYLQDGDRVLIKVDQVRNLGTIQYLFKDVEISHYSVVNPTAYDERLLEYWKMYPEKAPNVIIVDCWYGQLMTDPQGWLMQYIENDFGYTKVDDGRYIRIYRRY